MSDSMSGGAESASESNATESDTNEANLETESNDDDDDEIIETRFERLNEKRRQDREDKKNLVQKAANADRENNDEDDSPVKEAKKEVKESKNDDDDLEELVIDGKTQKLSKKQIKEFAQKAAAADKRFREASDMRKQAEQIIRLLKENPWEVLSHPQLLGDKLREKAEDLIFEKIQWDAMSEEEKERANRDKKLKDYEEREARTKKEQEEKEFNEAKERYTKAFHQDIIQSLEKNDLPKTPGTIKKLAYYMAEARKRGYPANASDVVELVRDEYFADENPLYNSLDGAKLVKRIGTANAEKIRKYFLDQAKGNGGFQTPKEQNPMKETRATKNPSKGLGIYEWRERMERIKRGEE